MISYNGNETSYRVEVRSFRHKMETWNPGRVIHLRSFYHDGIEFRLRVFPNGSEMDSEDYVSIFLHNLSNKDVLIDGDIEMSGERLEFERTKVNARSSKGWPKFFDVDKLRFRNAQDDDQDLVISVTIKKLWKDHEENELSSQQSQSHGIQRMQTVQLPSIHTDIKLIRKSNYKLETGMESLVKRMEALETRSVVNSSNWRKLSKEDRNQLIPKPECPVCFDEMTPETKIAQCVRGHHLCWGCKRTVQDCPSCALPVNGRAIAMEHYIQTLFQ